MHKKDIKILSIETSGSICGVALMEDDKILFSENITEPNMHDKMLASIVRKAMKQLDDNYNELDSVAVSSGPGSFTGLRIGAALAKGLTFETDTKLIAVPTIDAIAWHYLPNLTENNKEILSVLIPSHKNLIYKRDFDANFNPLTEIELVKIDEIRENVQTSHLFAGPGAKLIKTESIIQESLTLDSKIIAKYAYKLYFDKSFVPSEDFVPLYVQDFVPKTKGFSK